MRRSLFWRIFIPLLFLTLLSLCLIKFGLEPHLINLFEQISLQDSIRNARFFSNAISYELVKSCDSSTIDQLTQNLVKSFIIKANIIIPNCGNRDLTPINLNSYDNQPIIKDALLGNETNKLIPGTDPSTFRISTTVPLKSDGQIIGVLTTDITQPLLPPLQYEYINWLYFGLLLFIPIALFLAWVISSLYFSPIKKMAEEITDLVENQKGETHDYDRNDEIGYLSRVVLRTSVQIKDSLNKFTSERNTFATILSNMNDGILIVDEVGNVQLINRAASQMFSVAENEAINHSLVEVLRHHLVEELWEKCKADRQQVSANIEVTQNHLLLLVIATPLEPQFPSSILLLFQDLTHIRQLEIIRQDFVSNVSHELRTPLTSLKLLTETLQEGVLKDPPAAKKFLEKMDGEIDNLTQIVQELLELSKIESGKVPLQKTPILPCNLIKQAVDRMLLQAERGKLSLLVECAADLPQVEIDVSRMEQVLVNLIHNAIKFTPPGGKIIVSSNIENNEVIFSVKDTGVGIPPKDLERIFERFYKVDRARSNRGTGLGLSIARHLVEAHGGRIWVDSIQTQGSVFYFSIPINPANK